MSVLVETRPISPWIDLVDIPIKEETGEQVVEDLRRAVEDRVSKNKSVLDLGCVVDEAFLQHGNTDRGVVGSAR